MARLSIALVTSMLLLSASTASAVSKTWTAQESLDAGAMGSILSMEINDISSDLNDGNAIWEVAMTLNTFDYFGNTENQPRVALGQIGFGAIQHWAASSSNPSLISVTSPSFLTPDISSDWGPAAIAGNVSSAIDGPCVPSQQNAFKVCSEGYSNINADRGLYVWVFQVIGGDLQDKDEWHWGGQYTDLNAAGQTSGWIISTDDFIIPEPSAALVFAIGFGVISAAQRKR